jgi:hypothetical protein
MSLALFLTAWLLLITAFGVWFHRAVTRTQRPARKRSRFDIGRLADRHPWLVWLTGAIIAAAWLAHNANAHDSESSPTYLEGAA